MNLDLWFDFVLFILLFVLFIYVFVTVTITRLHKVYFLFHFFMILWPLSQFAADISISPEYQLFYVSLSFVMLTMLGGGWLLLITFLTGRADQLNWRRVILLFAPAVIASIGIMLNPDNAFVAPLDDGYIQRTYGPWFWLIIVILLTYLFVSLYLIVNSLKSETTTKMMKQQVKITLWGILVMAFFGLTDLLLNVILKPWLPIIPGLTSAGIFLSDIFFVFAMVRYNVFDIVSIAYKDVINNLSYGILVLDVNETIIEVNQALKSFNFKVDQQFDIGKFLESIQVDGNQEQFLEKYSKREYTQIEVLFGNDQSRHIIMQVAPIVEGHSRVGRTITFQDVSQLRYLVNEMNRKNNMLEERNLSLINIRDELFQANKKLEEMANTDSLTQCYNRRYLTQQLTHEVMTNRRYGIPFSLILIDIDFFKAVNDQYGHLIGDAVLCSTVQVINQSLRRTDILARYGGEEFIIYLPHTDHELAQELAENIRLMVNGNQIFVNETIKPISITISLGVLSIERSESDDVEHPEEYINELFSEVDRALYRAKEKGRNRVEMVNG